MPTTNETSPPVARAPQPADPLATCRCADWMSEGDSRVVELGELRVVVRYVGRKGRRGRIVIEAPAGAACPEACAKGEPPARRQRLFPFHYFPIRAVPLLASPSHD